MPLEAGTTLGTYEILSPLGAGGMGEVYRARDTKLGREVAIKVLPEDVGAHPEKLARFEREARLLAVLKHPGIATLHGLEEADGKPFLVMELVEGETLAERLSRGPVPVEEALPIARQIAEAVEAAHESGIVHRDLKPANVKVDAEGTVKVLDFGLAKAFAEEDAVAGGLSESPTLSREMTQAGVILGTAAYMSPEQAKGKALDRRTDVFSFGVLLYELLTGRKAFAGEDVPEVLAGIINKEPEWSALPSGLDARVQRLLEQCLRKDRRKRRQSMGDVRVEIEDVLARPEERTASGTERPRRRLLELGGAALLAGTLVALVTWSLRPVATPRVVRVAALPASVPPVHASLSDTSVAISRDGRRIAYLARAGAERQIVVRDLDDLTVRVLDTGGQLRGPFFSPSGDWVGYFGDGESVLRKAPVQGGPPVTLCEFGGGNPRGASWGEDGTIVFATSGTRYGASGLLRVPDSGGNPEELTQRDEFEDDHYWPDVLPGGEAILFTMTSEPVEDPRIAVFTLATGTIEVLVHGGSHPRYSPTGHIVYGVGGDLYAVPFDVKRLAVTGDPRPVLEGIVTEPSGAVEFDLSDEGALVYVAGGEIGEERTLVWVDREGREEALAAEPRPFTYPRLSPDGTRVAASAAGEGQGDIWLWDLERETTTRLTFDGASGPVWSPDGRRVAFSSARDGGVAATYWRAADGTGGIERLSAESRYTALPSSFSPDGGWLVLQENSPPSETGRDFLLRSMEDGTVQPLLATKSHERSAEISPDGRWFAYESNESGQWEVYVRPFPDAEAGRWQISETGGTRPVWARDGSALFYLDGGDRLTEVPVRLEPSFEYGRAEVVLERNYFALNTLRTYDVSPDGERFLMIKEDSGSPDDAPPEVILVLNWSEELKRVAPVD